MELLIEESEKKVRQMMLEVIQEKRQSVLQELLRALQSNYAEMPGLQAPIYFDYGCNTTFGKFSGANENNMLGDHGAMQPSIHRYRHLCMEKRETHLVLVRYLCPGG